MSILFGNAQTLEWANLIQGTSYDYGYLVQPDNLGRVYASGFVTKPMVIPIGVISSNSNSNDVHLFRYDQTTGVFEQGFLIAGTGFDHGRGIATDAFGNVYSTGRFEFNPDFNPLGSPLIPQHPNPPLQLLNDAYIAKYDPNGILIWVRWIGDNVGFLDDLEEGRGISVDVSGNVYVTGIYNGTVDFDPGPGTFNLTSANIDSDIFLMSLDINGNFRWAKRIGGTSNIIDVECMAMDSQKNIYIGGKLSGTADFDPNVGTFNINGTGAFIAKYNEIGDLIWARNVGSGVSYAWGLDVNLNDRIFFAGQKNNNIYFARLSPTNGGIIWDKILSNSGLSGAFCIDSDNLNNVYVGGFYANTIDLDPGPGTSQYTSNGSFNAWFGKYNPIGDFEYGYSFGGTYIDQVYDIKVSNPDEFYITGIIEGTSDFDPHPTNQRLLSDVHPAFGAFIAKYSNSTVLPVELLTFEGENQNAINVLRWSTATETNNLEFHLERSSDLLFWNSIIELPGAGTSLSLIEYSAIDSNPLPLSYYRLRQIDLDGTSHVSETIAIQSNMSNIIIYPNPVNKKLTVKSNRVEEWMRVFVYQQNGGVVFEEEIHNEDRIIVPFEESKNGVYVIRVMTNTNDIRKKVIKRQ